MQLRKITRMVWRRHLGSEHGQEGLAWLLDSIPRIPATDAHSSIFGAGKVEGYRDCLDKLNEITDIREKEEVDAEQPPLVS